MLGEITHLQGIIDDLVVLTAEPHKLPPASEQVCPAWAFGWEQWRWQAAGRDTFLHSLCGAWENLPHGRGVAAT